MRVIELDKQKECMSWGQQGESGATTLVANITDFLAFGAGSAVVIFQRQDGHPYIHKFTIDGENLFVTLTQVDTQLVGKCEISISWVVGSRTAKKKNYRSFILPSALEGDLPLTEESIAALDNLEQYVEEAKDLVANAQQFAAELVFVNSLPADGQSGKLYIEKNTNDLYFWDGTQFVLMSGGDVPDYDFVHGGHATTTYESGLSGGNAPYT